MIVRSSGDYFISSLDECCCHGTCILSYLLDVSCIVFCKSFAEGYGFCCYDMFKRTALTAGENSRIQNGTHHLDFAFRGFLAHRVREVFAHKYHTASRSSQCFVSRRCNDVAILDGIVQLSFCYKTGRVRDVAHKDCSYLICQGSHSFPIEVSRISTCTADYQLRLMFSCNLFHHIVIDGSGFFFHCVCNLFEVSARDVYRRAVGEVSSVVQIQSHESIARVKACKENGKVCLCSGMRLNVCPTCSE